MIHVLHYMSTYCVKRLLIKHMKPHGSYTVDLRRGAGGRGAVTPAPQMEVPAMAVLRELFQVLVPRSPLPDSVLHPQGTALKRHLRVYLHCAPGAPPTMVRNSEMPSILIF